jgi:hypothetical protein
MRRLERSPLWIGNARDARDFRALFDEGIQAVVALALEELPAPPPREMTYCRFPLLDGPGNAPWLLQLAIEVTARLIHARTPTLLCCSGGMSRSPAIAAAALSRVRDGSPEEHLTTVAGIGPADVAPGLWQEVLQTLGDLRHDSAAPENPLPVTP